MTIRRMDNPARADILIRMDHDSDILIVGGGLTGPALALAAAQAGLTVTVIDSLTQTVREDAAFDGRAYALALASVRLLGNIGIWSSVADNAQAMLEIKVSDGRAGEGAAPFFLHFDHAEIEEGPMGHMLEDRFLRRAFLEAMQGEDKIAQVTDTVTAQEVTQTGVTLTLASGKTLAGRIVVGSDGRASGTAQRAGIARTGWSYGQTALVAAIEHEQPHNGIAHQFFMPPARSPSCPCPAMSAPSSGPRPRPRRPASPPWTMPTSWRSSAPASAISWATSPCAASASPTR